MKFRYSLCLVVACLSSPAFSQSTTTPPLISVSGSAQIKVVPDEIYLRVGVETRNANLEESKRQNDERVAKVIGFLKASGIVTKDIQTDFLSIEPSYDDSARATVQMFAVRKSIEIKITAIDKFESVMAGLLKNGVNHVHGVEFKTSQLRKHRDAARASAVKAATEKADALAASLGVKRGKVYSVNANDWGGWATPSYWGGRYGNQLMQNNVQSTNGEVEATETLSLGQINVSGSVNVSFLIQ
jgi:uncharacterized protein